MKKLLTVFLCIALVLSVAGCAADAPQPEGTTPAPEVITAEVKAELDAVLEEYKYEGIVYLTHNGEVVYQSVSGTNDMG